MGLKTIERKRNLLFVGPPGAGKTVFFSTMVNRLVNQAIIRGSLLSCIPKDFQSRQFVESVLHSLKEQVWPKEGGAIEAFGELEYTLTCKGWLYDLEFSLTCCDYAGETFIAAYGNRDKLDIDVDEEQVRRLKKQVDTADIVFLIGNAVSLHDGKCRDFAASLFGAAISLIKKHIRTAFILTQKDEFEGLDFAEEGGRLVVMYPDLYAALLKIHAEFFWISSVTAVTDAHGRRVPPKDYDSSRNSIDLLAPINWALALPETSKD